MWARQPHVSLITPTKGRPHSLRAVYDCLKRQKGARWEWRILDDSPQADPFFVQLDDARVHYNHTLETTSVGAKRNALVEQARAPVIAHIDDDDYYAPDYLRALMRAQTGGDFVKLSAFYLFDTSAKVFGYWDLCQREGWHVKLGDGAPHSLTIPEGRGEEAFGNNVWGYGFSYLYRREVWQACPFKDISHNEDGRFVQAAQEAGFDLRYVPDTQGLCLHMLHGSNASAAHAQFILPPFMLPQVFGDDVVPFVQLMAAGAGAP